MILSKEEPSDDIAVIKSRKMVEQWTQAIFHEKANEGTKLQLQQQSYPIQLLIVH